MTCLAAATDWELRDRVAYNNDPDAYAELVKRGLAFALSQYQQSATRKQALNLRRLGEK